VRWYAWYDNATLHLSWEKGPLVLTISRTHTATALTITPPGQTIPSRFIFASPYQPLPPLIQTLLDEAVVLATSLALAGEITV
jgi:hypothetical protein